MDDVCLVEKLRNKEENAFNMLVEQYSEKVYKFAFHITKNREDAEDSVQETMLSVFKNIDTFRGNSSFNSWIYRIASNFALMKLRVRTKHGIIDEGEREAITQRYVEKGRAELNYLTIKQEMRLAIFNALTCIPADYREIFILRDVEEISNEEACRLLSSSLASVKSKLHRARTLLRHKLKKYYDEYKAEPEMFYYIRESYKEDY